jgi:hypothetical protein
MRCLDNKYIKSDANYSAREKQETKVHAYQTKPNSPTWIFSIKIIQAYASWN